MQRKITFLFVLFLSINTFSQKDSIINYLDRNNLLTNIKEDAVSVEIISKVNDTLWKREKISRTGKLLNYTHYKSKEKKIQIGESVSYHFNNKVATLVFYNHKGLLNGKEQRWFYNGGKDREGLYVNGNREGVWKFYHFNGKLAAKLIYKNDVLVNSYFLDEKGNRQKDVDIKNSSFTNRPFELLDPPNFKGGEAKYIEKLQDIITDSNYDIRGKIRVSYTIDINGKIIEVTLDEKVPEKLAIELKTFMQGLKGWSSGVNLNRKVPVRFSQVFNFK